MANLPVPFRYEYLMAETLFSQVRFCFLNFGFVAVVSFSIIYEIRMISFFWLTIPIFSRKVFPRAVVFRYNNWICFFFQILLLPQPPFKTLYYTLVIMDLCKVGTKDYSDHSKIFKYMMSFLSST